MSDEGRIALDDLILFFKRPDAGKNEVIVNRWIPHDFYTAEERRVEVKPEWQDAVLSEPSTGAPGQHYYVANLARLTPPDEKRAAKQGQAKPRVELGSEDLVVFPPEDPNSCYRVSRADYEEKCKPLPPVEIPDLEFMAREEGVVLANVPKVTPQGCTCILLSLVGLRSGTLKKPLGADEKRPAKGDEERPVLDKTEQAKHMHERMRLGHKH